MDYAKKSLNLFSPSLSNISNRCAAASASVLPSFNPRPRPFRVTNSDRSVKKGIMADGLRDLLNKTMDAFSVSCVAGMVLDEDGTGVDTEDFFQTLKDSTVLMVLEKGQKWTPQQSSQLWGQAAERRTQRRKDLAKLTLDFYKNHPKEFIGCLNVQMTLYGMYSLSYDLQCYHAKRMLREALRWTLFSMQATGHVLLGTSYYMQHLIDEDEKAEAQLTASRNTNKPLQAIQWKKTTADHRN
ncbi:hypothetical protein PGIGA_G00108910 [Pangasianodon gigas]|uniref:Uncharacterized protein n=1 Tax=Pangasianodon gigas TaxID=30993 RepID=A0ACC5W944_PANGG|nr:hypothetical protein [Pangasianodon gigas]